MTLLADYQPVKECAATHLCSSGHHDPERLVHDFGEGPGIAAQTSGAETWGNHGNDDIGALGRAESCKLAYGALLDEFSESVSIATCKSQSKRVGMRV
jgi:hypothetical protein